VLRQALAYRFWRRPGLVLRQVRVDALRGRRNRQSENIVQQPFAPEDWRSTIRVRRCRQQRAFSKQSSPLIVIRERDPAEAAAVNSGNSVMPRQPFVDKR